MAYTSTDYGTRYPFLGAASRLALALALTLTLSLSLSLSLSLTPGQHTPEAPHSHRRVKGAVALPPNYYPLYRRVKGAVALLPKGQ